MTLGCDNDIYRKHYPPTPPPRPASMVQGRRMVSRADRGRRQAGQAAMAKGNGQTVCGVGWVGGLLLFVCCLLCTPLQKFSSFSRNSWLT